MNLDELLKSILEKYKNNEVTLNESLDNINRLLISDIGFAQLDFHRQRRLGFPEVIYGEGKDKEMLVNIIQRMKSSSIPIIVTRVNEEKAMFLKHKFPDVEYYNQARVLYYADNKFFDDNFGPIAVVAAGTSDIPIAEEAAVISTITGNKVNRVYDVGVAGLHRLFKYIDQLLESKVIIVIAGMEGALPSVIGGLIPKPIIAVPTSVGYGANFSGLTPLLGMLNSCAPGITVVNIDNGFGAAYAASLITGSIPKKESK